MVQRFKTVEFCINSFVWKKCLSIFLPPLSIAEGMVLDWNLYFRVIFGEFAQNYEGEKSDMTPSTADEIALGSSGNP